MSKGGGETRYVTQSTSNAPPGYIQDAQKYGVQQAREQLDSNKPQYYPDSTVVDFAPQTQQALQMTEQRALQGSPLLQAGQDAMLQTAQGDFLGSNPYFDQAVNAALDPVQDRINSQFSAAGRTGSGAHTDVMASELGKIAGQLSYRNYADERGRMMQAAGMAPQMSQADYMDAMRLGEVGAAREGKAGERLQENINRFNFDQNVEQDKLARYMALVSGGQFGNEGTSSQPVFSNPTGNFLGSLASVAGIGSMAFGSPSGGGFLRGIL